jgi:membrane fusion protein, multidrug efflux system
MYRERDQLSVATDLHGEGRWQDWPPDTSSARFEGEPALAPSQQLKTDANRGERADVSYYRAPVAPSAPKELPAPLRDAPLHDAFARDSAADASANGAKPRRRAIRKFALVLGALVALGVAGWYGDYWWTTGRYLVSTDDAYVGAKNATLAAKITGYVAAVTVDDNAHVRAGDVIARIDDGDYQLSVKTAHDNIATQQATVDRIGKQVTAQEAAVDQAKAQVASAQAGQTRAELELKRQRDLAARSYASQQTLEQVQANRDQAVAAVQSAQAALEAARAQVDVLKAQQVEALRTLDQFKTALAKAERDRSFTVIRAPFDGVIGNRAMQVGDLVQPGQRLASLVPLDAVYVDANFKETQLADLHPGQPVAISVDAYSGRKLVGSVVSVAPASGSVFSLLPPDNATGNFTKIVQRLPVRIAVPTAVAEQGLLRPGMSVVVSVDTKPGAVAANKSNVMTADSTIKPRRVR